MTTTVATFAERYGPWALVTGASSGLGAQFSRSIAKRGVNVILVARRGERLEELSAEIRRIHSVQTHVLPLDLTAEGAKGELEAVATQFEIGLLVNNAGVGVVGAMLATPVEGIERLIALNVHAVAQVARVVGEGLMRRGRGGMVFVSSLNARPGPYQAVYSASKSFVSTLAVSLRYELCGHGVEVLAFEPGAVRSEMLDELRAIGELDRVVIDPMETELAVEMCLAALGKEVVYTPGWKNRVFKFIVDYLPRWLVLPLFANVLRTALPPERVALAF